MSIQIPCVLLHPGEDGLLAGVCLSPTTSLHKNESIDFSACGWSLPRLYGWWTRLVRWSSDSISVMAFELSPCHCLCENQGSKLRHNKWLPALAGLHLSVRWSSRMQKRRVLRYDDELTFVASCPRTPFYASLCLRSTSGIDSPPSFLSWLSSFCPRRSSTAQDKSSPQGKEVSRRIHERET